MTPTELTNHLSNCGHSVAIGNMGSRPIQRVCSINQPKSDGVAYYNEKRWKAGTPPISKLGFLIAPDSLPDDIYENMIQLASDHDCSLVRVGNPRLAIIDLVQQFFSERLVPNIHPTAVVDKTSTIHPTAGVGMGSYIGPGVSIGAGTFILEYCVIKAAAKIGDNCLIGPGVSIGQSGFGYERDINGTLRQFPHVGSVVIGSNVDIGANSCIDRGTIDDTIILDGVKIDNLCHISHNVYLGEGCVVIANSMIGGSVEIGDRAWIAPSVSVINGVSIGAGSTIGIGSCVTKPVSRDVVAFGSPAEPMQVQLSKKRFLETMMNKRQSEGGSE